MEILYFKSVRRQSPLGLVILLYPCIFQAYPHITCTLSYQLIDTMSQYQ